MPRTCPPRRLVDAFYNDLIEAERGDDQSRDRRAWCCRPGGVSAYKGVSTPNRAPRLDLRPTGARGIARERATRDRRGRPEQQARAQADESEAQDPSAAHLGKYPQGGH